MGYRVLQPSLPRPPKAVLDFQPKTARPTLSFCKRTGFSYSICACRATPLPERPGVAKHRDGGDMSRAAFPAAPWRWTIAGALLLLAAAAGTPLHAQTAPPPAPNIHLGVATCGGSTCHGSMEQWKGSHVQQNEYIIWTKKDKHAQAYSVLSNERSKRIVANLGLKAATEEPLCLECHADLAPQDQRGARFQISDGVGCEACHGAASRWLGVHVSGVSTHQNNLSLGMYPTDQPVARAQLCLSCHFGDGHRFVTHRMMGAGHPRINFMELDTFTAVEPAHFVVNDTYRSRKRAPSGVQVWAIGQAIALSKALDAIMDPKRNTDGLFPELVLFDCFACHHSLNDLRWQSRAATGLGPGVPRLNDANLVMLRLIAERIAPGTGKELTERGLALHQAATKSREAMAEAARALKEVVSSMVPMLDQHQFGREDLRALLDTVAGGGLRGDEFDYAAAEQSAMALSAIIHTMKNTGAVDEKQFQALDAALNRVYEAVNKADGYKMQAFLAALAEFRRAIPSG